jgi:hypothetical protein
MNIKKILITISFLFNTMIILGQGFSYTFTDPCTFKQKQIYIDNPSGSVLLTYNGSAQSFTQQQLQSGDLEEWITQVNSSNPNGPCSGVGLAQNTNMNVLITQNNIAVLTNVMSALNDIGSIGGTSIGGIVEAKEKSSSDDNKRKNKNTTNYNNRTTTNTNNSATTNTNNSTNNGQGGQTINGQNQTNGQTNEGNTENTGGAQTNQSNQTGGNTNPNNGTETPGNGTTTETSGGVEGNPNNPTQGGSSQTQSTVGGGNKQQPTNGGNENNEVSNQGASDARNTSSAKEKVANAKQGGIVLNGDIVVINSATKGESQQLRVNMSVVKSNTDNTIVKGALLNFTTAINNSSLTFFVGKKVKNFTGIVANSSMLNFQKDFFNTTSLMTSYKYKKITSTLGVNYTTGNLGQSRFNSLSALGGGVGTFKVTKKITNTTMMVVVYSPFVYYYEGLWYKSGLLLVPFTAFDYRLTPKFKLNLSFSGVQQIKSTAINYQVLLGAKALL